MNRLAMIIMLTCLFNYLTAEERLSDKPLKILHLTFHRGCIKEFEGIAKKLNVEVENWFIPDLPPYFFDGVSRGNVLYNIGHERAKRIWEAHRQTFETFDMILVSDTAPLSRIFLQNQWKKPLIIWICNRFDYADQATLDCEFPDQEYYDLFQQACQASNVTVIAYTEFEHYYAKTKNVATGNLTITPCGAYQDEDVPSAISPSINKPDVFFLPPYHNEKRFMDLSSFLNELGIQNFCGRYNGPLDLKDFKGIIHLPYSWSNLAFFENIQVGIPYFIPSRAFLEQLTKQGNYFHPELSLLIREKLYDLSEWYSPKNQEAFIYFDSWEDLEDKIQKTNYPAAREKILLFAQRYQTAMLTKWKKAFEKYALIKD